MNPTHFYCLRHGKWFYCKDYEEHCYLEHGDRRDEPVMIEERRCVHGTLIDRDWLFCCDYESW